jgi:hypothetical protein
VKINVMSMKKGASLIWLAPWIFGSPARTRTTDMVINSHPLYRLSYWGTNETVLLSWLFGLVK